MLNGLEVTSAVGMSPVFDARHFSANGVAEEAMEGFIDEAKLFLSTVVAAKPRPKTPLEATYGWGACLDKDPSHGILTVASDWNTIAAQCRTNVRELVTIVQRATPIVSTWSQWGDKTVVADEIRVEWPMDVCHRISGVHHQ